MFRTTLTVAAVTVVSLVASSALAQDPPPTATLVVTVNVDETKLNGKAWDVGGGKPDAKLTCRAQSNGRKFEALAKDSFSVSVKVTTVVGDKLSCTVVDKDAMANDPVGSFSVIVHPDGDGAQMKFGPSTAVVNYLQ